MGDVFDLSTVAKRFRFIAFLEALSWVGLIVGMVYKRLPEPVEWPVKVFGMTHGIIFILFVLMALVAAREFGWGLKTVGLMAVSAIVPFCTVPFELWVARTGQLGELSSAPEPMTH